MYLRNAWYVAAWDREVGRTPLARTFLDEPVVLYRKRGGSVVAMEDRCCHRHLPLSLGAVVDDDLRCGYHGMRYDASGKCVEIPGQSTIPRQARIVSYPVVERHGFVWIWMGDAERADPALIPNIWWADHPDWVLTKPDMYHLKCDYRLIADNVLDASHLAYVHATSIGNGGLTEVDPRLEREERLVRVTRWVLDRPPPPAYKKAGNFPGNVDRWAIVQHQPPACSVNFAGCVDVGCGGPNGDRSKSSRAVELVAISLPTPETATTCHYFFAFARAFAKDDPVVDEMFSKGFVEVFHEDFVILEAQQRMLNLKPDAPKVDFKADAASIFARRMLNRMIAEEQARQVHPDNRVQATS